MKMRVENFSISWLLFNLKLASIFIWVRRWLKSKHQKLYKQKVSW